MHYIRFLKLPRCTTEHGTLEVHALITVASDLGESFFPDAFTLRAQAICGEKVHASKTFEWDGSMRSLKIQMRITQKLASPFLLKLTALDINDKAPRQAEGVAILPIILDAWSGLVDPRGKLDVEKMVERRFTFDDKEELRIWEETGESLARHLWPGGVTLMNCVYRSRDTSSGLSSLDAVLKRHKSRKLRAIELGAGCGLVGLALAKILPGVEVLLTDLVEAEEITNRNISSAVIKKPTKVSFEVLDWTQPLTNSASNRQFDLVLIADCTYNADFIPALVSTLVALMIASPDALVVVATKTRHSSEAVFFELMRTARFKVIEETHALAPTRYPIEEPDDAERIDVYCFRYEAAERSKRIRHSPPAADGDVSRTTKRLAVARKR